MPGSALLGTDDLLELRHEAAGFRFIRRSCDVRGGKLRLRCNGRLRLCEPAFSEVAEEWPLGAHCDLVVGRKGGLESDRLLVYPEEVLPGEVLEPVLLLTEEDLGMLFADGGMIENEMALRTRADDNGHFFEGANDGSVLYREVGLDYLDGRRGGLDDLGSRCAGLFDDGRSRFRFGSFAGSLLEDVQRMRVSGQSLHRDLFHLGEETDFGSRLGEGEHVAVFQERFCNSLAVHEGAVGAVVAEPELVAVPDDRRMFPRDDREVGRKANLAGGLAADHYGVFVELLDLAFQRTADMNKLHGYDRRVLHRYELNYAEREMASQEVDGQSMFW